MAYGDPVSKPYTAGGTPTDSLSGRDLGRAAVAGLTPMVQEITHEITGMLTLAPVQVATPGTPVKLAAASLLIRRAIVQALPTNSSIVVVGDSNVVAAIGTQAAPTRRGFALSNPGSDYLAFEFNDLTNIYIDALIGGDGVAVTYWT